MSGHTRYLEILALIASAFPTQIAALPALVGGQPRASHTAGRRIPVELWIVPVGVWLVAGLALAVSKAHVVLTGSEPLAWGAIAVAGAVVSLAAELVVGSVWSWAATGTFPRGIAMAERVAGSGAPLAASTAVTGFGEELLFRGVWLAILIGWNWPMFGVAVLTTVVYASNHAYLGMSVVAQKFCAGAIFFAIASQGGGVVASGVAHAGENVLIVFLPLLVAQAKPRTST